MGSREPAVVWPVDEDGLYVDEDCLAAANRRMCSPDSTLMDTKIAAVSATGDTRDLTDAEFAISYLAELIPTSAAPELGM